MFKVQSHTMWPYMCLCCGCLCPHNSISNVVVFVTIHDNMRRYTYIFKYVRVVAKIMKLLWKVINIYMCAYTCIFIHIHIHVHIYIYTYIHIYIYMYMYRYMYRCMCVCVCVSLSFFLRAVVVAVAGCCCCVLWLLWWRRERREETNQTMSQLIPSAVSLRFAETEQLYQAQRMIGGIGNVLLSTYSQTENG